MSSEELEGAVNAMLRVSSEGIYKLNADGTAYVLPLTLSGTPVARLNEGDGYWESDWSSLAQFFEEDAKEKALKEEFCEKRNKNPGNSDIQKKFKKHQDNVTIRGKIRLIFGGTSTYHPNQLVSKHHLPKKGLCNKELMYKLACHISKLSTLRELGELEMDPWDFLRWRVNKKVQEFIHIPGQSIGERHIRNICRGIAGDSKDEWMKKYEDPLLRKAILRAAERQGQLAHFRSGARIPTVAPMRPAGVGQSRWISRILQRETSQPVAEEEVQE